MQDGNHCHCAGILWEWEGSLMDDDILRSLESFERVWKRVSVTPEGPPEPPRPDDAALLRQFIEAEAADTAFYAALAKRCTGKGRGVLTKLSAQERCHLRRLQMEYFLLTGDSCAPPHSCPAPGGTLSALRMAYLDELAGGEQYLDAAGHTANANLQALYIELAEDERCHAVLLRELIGQALT
jgi:hypothetical protein